MGYKAMIAHTTLRCARCLTLAALVVMAAACSGSSEASDDTDPPTSVTVASPSPASSTTPPTTEPPMCTWTVAAGESLTAIAAAVGTGFDAAALREENGITNPNLVAVG